MNIYPPQKVKVVKMAHKGRAVVATEKICSGEIIELCPVIALGEGDSEFVSNKRKSDTLYYYYLHQPEHNRACIMLGYASLYNHSSEPNAAVDYEDVGEATTLIFRAIKDIAPDEEITWNYKFDNDEVEFLPTAKPLAAAEIYC